MGTKPAPPLFPFVHTHPRPYLWRMKRLSIALVVSILALLVACRTTPEVAENADSVTQPGEPQDVSDSRLPVDPQVSVGRLPNGLTYYIRENDEPRDRAFLRLAVNAGSILEDESQLGLAHFLEHMAFNGTESYSGNEIIAFLETLGMEFGPDVNAYTSFDETVYELTLPTDDPERFERGLRVLEEWAHRMTLSEEAIDGERGVIIEEWRFRRGAAARMREVQYPVLFWNSRYAERLPIGDVDLIAEFPYEDLRRFYRDWYRPELMAVVAVGDFETAEVQELIADIFAAIPATESGADRPYFDVPDHEDTKYVVASDPETSYTEVSFVVKRDAQPLESERDYRDVIVGGLFASMLDARMQEIGLKPDAPFLAAGVSVGGLVRTEAAASLSAIVEGNEVTEALEALVVEARRVLEHGFTPSELVRAKQNRLRSIEQAFRERENINSASFADEYVRAFLEDEAIPGIPYERDLVQRLLPTIELDELNALADEYLKEANRVVMVSAIEREDLPEVTETELAAALEAAAEVAVEPYEDRDVASTLLSGLPQPGSIVEQRELDAEGVVEWRLSNGIRLLIMSTEHRADQVLFSAFSPGGSSTVADEEFRSAQYATVFTEQMGYGELSAPDLQRALAGTAVGATPYIDTYYEGISGSASAEELELLLELIHLKLTAPRRDQAVYEALSRQLQTVVANQENQPRYLFSRRLQELYSMGHPRTMPIEAVELEEIDLDEILRVYEERFADFSEATFVFVGNVDAATFAPLAERYLASLPGTGRDESWQDVGIERPSETVRDTVRAGIEQIAEVALIYHGGYEFGQDANYTIRAVERMLDIRMQEVIREDESGTYGVGVQAQFARVPDERYSILITFRADPQRIEELTSRALEVVQELRTRPPEQEYLTRIAETQRASFAEGLTNNQFWLSQIEYAVQNGRPLTAIRRYLDLVESLTPQMVQDAAERYLDERRYVEVTLLPAE